MLAYALRRLLTFPLLLLVIYTCAALLLLATPGEAFDTGEKELPPEVLQQKRIHYNYLRLSPTTGEVEPVPWYERYYWIWPRRLLWDGDLPAHQYEDWTVVEIMRSALPVSLQLGVLSLGLAMMLGIGGGAAAVAFRGRWLEHVTVGLCLVGISLPTFVIGAGLLMLFGLWLRAMPVGGWGSITQAILPALTLSLPYAAYLARLTRASLLDAYSEDYIRTARAKGLSETRVLLDHALPNALLPALSFLGPAAAAIFTGSFVVEKIFAIPGMGTHVVESINNRDQTLILATVLVYSVFLASFNLLVDVLYGVIDPRIRVGEASRS
jgi:oligopeptide transport system permease protein